MLLQEQTHALDNLWMAYNHASRGKRGRGSTAAVELYLADNLLELQTKLREQTYHPGPSHSFYIHEPKRRLISAAPFRDRVVYHTLCNLILLYTENRFIAEGFANKSKSWICL
jgi:hypothetical protein